MANITGQITGYHDGNTYSLANIYDEKLNEYNILAGTSAKNIISVSFNTETGVDYYFDSDVGTPPFVFYQSTTLIASTASTNKPITKIIPYLSTEHAATGYSHALDCVMSTKRYAIIGSETYPIHIIPLTKDASGNYIKSIRPSFEYDGWFSVNTAKYASTSRGYTYHSVLYYLALQIAESSTTYNTPASNRYLVEEHDYGQFMFSPSAAQIGVTYWNNTSGQSAHYPNHTYVRTLDRSVFDRPFHLKVQWFNGIDNPNYIMLCFVDNELYSYIPRTPDDVDKEYYGYKIRGLYFGATRHSSNYPDNISVSSFKMSLLSPVYQKITVPANMLIRHNAANHYVPLTTNAANTSAPYLGIRHGSKNFYTLK